MMILRILTKAVCAGAVFALFLLSVRNSRRRAPRRWGTSKWTPSGAGRCITTSGTVSLRVERPEFMKAIFKDNVTMKTENMTLRCDNLVFIPSTSPTSVTLLRALGNPVKIEQEGVKAVCKKFEYFPEQKKAVLSGDAVIEMMLEGKPNTVTGKTITVIQMPDGTVQFLTSGPSSGDVFESLSGTGPKTEGENKSPGKDESGSGKSKDNSGKKKNKPNEKENKPAGSTPLEKITDKSTDENPESRRIGGKKERTMTRKEILAFVNENPVFFLATAQGNAPFVRGMMIFRADESGIYFCTAKHKDVYKQLEANPAAELSLLRSRPPTSRCASTGTWSRFHDLEIKKKVVEKFPFLKYPGSSKAATTPWPCSVFRKAPQRPGRWRPRSSPKATIPF